MPQSGSGGENTLGLRTPLSEKTGVKAFLRKTQLLADEMLGEGAASLTRISPVARKTGKEQTGHRDKICSDYWTEEMPRSSLEFSLAHPCNSS